MRAQNLLLPGSFKKWGVVILLALTLSVSYAQEREGGEILVKWSGGTRSPAGEIRHSETGAVVARNLHELGWQVVKLPAGMSVAKGLEIYRGFPEVAAVEVNGKVEVTAPASPISVAKEIARVSGSITPSDPMFSSQWEMRKISAPAAWATTTGSPGVVIAVVDSGVDYNHPDLAANMWRNPGETGVDGLGNDKATNGVDDDDNGYIDDVHGADVVNKTGDSMDLGQWTSPYSPNYHGTFIAGLIGAVGNNGKGIAGLNWNTQIMSVRFLYGDKADPKVYTQSLHHSQRLAAFDYILMMKRRGVNIRITNNSWNNYVENLALQDALALAGEEGILNVFCAGNQAANCDQFSSLPAATPLSSIISVAATTAADELAGWSNYGAGTIDLAAPGENVTSTEKGTGYSVGSGTSYATPLVVGAAALLLSVDPTLTVDQLKSALLGSVDSLPSLRGKVVTGGRLNVARALEYVTLANPLPIVIHTSPAGQRTTATMPIEVRLNRSMNRESVESAFVVKPTVAGTFTWADDNRSFAFAPGEPWDTRTNYTVRILGSAHDETGATLDGNFNRTSSGSPADDFVWTFRFPIANDDFVNAQPITGTSNSVSSSNLYGTYELSEPNHVGDITSTSSVWYRWTAPESGWVTFEVSGGFDALLAIYAGSELGSLVEVVANDNSGASLISRGSFAAAEGTTYMVAVAAKSEDVTKRGAIAGSFKLRWLPTPPPTLNGGQFTPPAGFPGMKITLTGINLTAVTNVLFNGVSATFSNMVGNYFDQRIIATVPADATTGPITVATALGNATTAISFRVLTLPRLEISAGTGGNLAISWPTNVAGFFLEGNSQLGTTGWVRPVEQPQTVNDTWTVQIPMSAELRLFRLRK